MLVIRGNLAYTDRDEGGEEEFMRRKKWLTFAAVFIQGDSYGQN